MAVDLKTWVRRLENAGPRVELQFSNLGRQLGAYAADKARKKLGKYQPESGPFSGWPPLSPATIADKISRGFPTPSPLLRTGAMRQSIGWEIEKQDAHEISINIFGDEPADFHEYGTIKMPPRPFMGPAVWEVVQELDPQDLESIITFVAGLDDRPVLQIRRKK